MRFLLSTLICVLCLAALPCAAAQFPPAYWLWAGLTEKDAPVDPDIPLYIYQGNIIVENEQAGYHHKGLFPSPLRHHHIFLVYRLDRNVEPQNLAAVYGAAVEAWANRGVVIEGLQVDCDWPTRKLGAYADYLHKLRALLPPQHVLSVTGLGDWAVHGDSADLSRMAAEVDAITYQLYRGHQPLPFTDDFTAALERLDTPFRLGLLPDRQENLVASVRGNPYYRGTIYFLHK